MNSWPGAMGRGGPLFRRSSRSTPGPSRFDALCLAIAVTLFAVVWRFQDLVTPLALLKPGWLGPVAVLLLFAQASDPRRNLRDILRQPSAIIWLLILGQMVIGVPAALYPGRSFLFVWSDFTPSLIVALLVAASIRDLADIERLFRIQVVGCLFFSAYVLMFFRVSSIGRFDELAYYDANDFAMVIVATIPLAAYLWRRSTKSWVHLAALAITGVFMLGLVKSGSRGGFLGLVAVSAVLLISFKAIPAKTRLGIVAAIFVGLVAFAGEQYWGFIDTLAAPEADYNFTSEGGRIEIWKRGMVYMGTHALTGVGARNFSIAEATISPQALAAKARGGWGSFDRAPHNSFVEIGAELGVPGLLLYVTNLIVAVVVLVRIARKDQGKPGTLTAASSTAIAQVLLASWIGYMVCGFFLTQAFAPLQLITLAMIMGLAKLQASAAPAPARPSAAAAPRRPAVQPRLTPQAMLRNQPRG